MNEFDRGLALGARIGARLAADALRRMRESGTNPQRELEIMVDVLTQMERDNAPREQAGEGGK